LDSKAKVEGTNRFWTLVGYLSSRYAEQEVDDQKLRTDNEISGGGRVQRKLFDGVSAFLSGDVEKDEFKDLRFRSVFSGGLGKLWLKDDRWFYETRFGVGFRHEEYANAGTRSLATGELVSDLKYSVNSHIALTQETKWLPDLADNSSYLIVAESAATFYLASDHGIFIKSGIKNEYDSMPVQQVKHLDNYYFTNLGYKF
jgi:putative salt-induced outer membrane protein YdiY